MANTLRLVWQYFVRIPFLDYWAFFFDLIYARGEFAWSLVWNIHNEHRLVLPKLIFYLDYSWNQARGTLPVAISLLSSAGTALLLARYPKPRPWWQTGLLIAILLGAGQLENSIIPFQVQMPLAIFFATAAFVFVDRLSLSIASALLATFSFGAGVFVWPILCLHHLLLRRWKALAATAGIAALTLAIYFAGGVTTRDPVTGKQPLSAYPLYILEYLGNPLSGFGLHIGIVWGCCILALLLLLLWQMRKHAWQPVPLMIAAFVGLSIVVACLTRIELFGWVQASEPRYYSFTLLLYAALAVALFSLPESRVRGLGLAALFGFCTLSLLANQVITFRTRVLSANLQRPELALRVGVNDREGWDANNVPQGPMTLAWDFFWDRKLATASQQLPSPPRLAQSAAQDSFVAEYFELIRDPSRSGVFLRGTWGDRKGPLIVDAAGAVHGVTEPVRGNRGFMGMARLAPGLRLVDPQGNWTPLPVEVPQRQALPVAFGIIRESLFADVNRDFTFGPKDDAIFAVSSGVHILPLSWQGRVVTTFVQDALWTLDTNRDMRPQDPDPSFRLGEPGDQFLSARWSNGLYGAATFRNGHWRVDRDTDGKPDWEFDFGSTGDIAIAGDWTRSGRACPGTFRAGLWTLDINCDGRFEPGVDKQIRFGDAGDTPLYADWDGYFGERPGLFREGRWRLDMNGDWTWKWPVDAEFYFGQKDDRPASGAWSLPKLATAP